MPSRTRLIGWLTLLKGARRTPAGGGPPVCGAGDKREERRANRTAVKNHGVGARVLPRRNRSSACSRHGRNRLQNPVRAAYLCPHGYDNRTIGRPIGNARGGPRGGFDRRNVDRRNR